MTAEFIDYRKNKGYWFMIELSIAEEICKNPSLSVKNSTFELNDLDILEVFDQGLIIYKYTDKFFKMR